MVHGQKIKSENVQEINITYNQDFEGFDLLDSSGVQLFFLGEEGHNKRQIAALTLKFLQYLYEHANVRILAVEHGYSTAYLLNEYLANQDSMLLKQISRNTMYWGKENFEFIKELARFNNQLPSDQKIIVKSIDIEYKQECAILVLNKLIGDKMIPEMLSSTLGEFQKIFLDTKSHREQFDGLNVLFYYDRELVHNLVVKSLEHLKRYQEEYQHFFGEQFDDFKTILTDMDYGYIFDYSDVLTNYDFRDSIIYERFISLYKESPNKGVLCAIGEAHVTAGSSGYKLKYHLGSPYHQKVSTIHVTSLNRLGIIEDAYLRKVNRSVNKKLQKYPASLIKHENKLPVFKGYKHFDFSVFINDKSTFTSFENSYKGKTALK